MYWTGKLTATAGYMYYHFSGAKKAVDASRAASQYYQETKAAIASKAPKSPNEALDYLRDVARSYLVVIPGARPHVDAAFDTIDELRDTHGEDVNRIVSDGYEEVRVIIKDSGSMDAGMAMKILDVLRRRSAELEELGKKAGKDAVENAEEGVKHQEERAEKELKDLVKQAEAALGGSSTAQAKQAGEVPPLSDAPAKAADPAVSAADEGVHCLDRRAHTIFQPAPRYHIAQRCLPGAHPEEVRQMGPCAWLWRRWYSPAHKG